MGLPGIPFGHLATKTFRLYSPQFVIFKNGSIRVPEQLFPGELVISDIVTRDIPDVEITSSDAVLFSLL